MAVARSNPDIAFIYTFVRYVDSSARVVHDGPDQRFPQRALCRGIYESLAGGNSSALMLRSAALECGGYDEDLVSWEDLLLQLEITARAPIAFVPEYLVGYRIRPVSLSANVPAMLDSWRIVREKIRRRFPGVPAMVDRWAHARRCAEFAEAFAWRGDYPMCLRLLAEAATLDWRWTSQLLRYRLIRRLGRGFSDRPGDPRLPHFRDCDPTERIAGAPVDQPSPLSVLERERIARIAQIDQELAVTPARLTMRPLPEAAEGSSPPAPVRP
jgi:hypothetical protein